MCWVRLTVRNDPNGTAGSCTPGRPISPWTDRSDRGIRSPLGRHVDTPLHCSPDVPSSSQFVNVTSKREIISQNKSPHAETYKTLNILSEMTGIIRQLIRWWNPIYYTQHDAVSSLFFCWLKFRVNNWFYTTGRGSPNRLSKIKEYRPPSLRHIYPKK
jgi:hypothetical protein